MSCMPHNISLESIRKHHDVGGTSPTDDHQSTIFQQLFQKVSDAKSVRRGSEASPVPIDVGNPTVTCHQDGGSDDSADLEEKYSIQENFKSEKNDQDEKEGNKQNSNNWLPEAMATFSSQHDRRIFTDFEAAGLPRKEITRLAHALHESVVAGRQAVSLGLRVPELGELRFDVRIAGKVVLIHAFVENEQASTALALAISTLKAKLEEHKLVLGRLDVTIQNTKNRSVSSHRREREILPDERKRKNRMLPSLECLEDEAGIDG